MVYSPPGTLIWSAPRTMLASWIAARSVQRPVVVAQTPLPTFASTTSAVLSTVNSAARAAAGTIAMTAQIADSTNQPCVLAVLASMDQPLVVDFRRAANPRTPSAADGPAWQDRTAAATQPGERARRQPADRLSLRSSH
jgi:hypothetical protein